MINGRMLRQLRLLKMLVLLKVCLFFDTSFYI